MRKILAKATGLGLLMVFSLASQVAAIEGMWRPQQLPELKEKLKESGLELDPETLGQLTEHPMAAVVSLGGCSASFVSPEGLVITNHHCAFGSIRYNSRPNNNLLEKGFLAKTTTEELQATPGSRVYVTVAVDNVTDRIINFFDSNLTGFDRYRAITEKQKQLVRECERDEGYRCRVYSYHGGLEYYLIKRLEIRDVRLVYAPSSRIGFFGGDTDNWQWPRHTGDFAFYRAYVDKNGHPADYSPDNVPYQPKHYLKIAPTGLQPEDFVMVIGYPGRTNRYRLAKEVDHAFNWYYPTYHKFYVTWSETIEQATKNNEEAKIKYASDISGLNNAAKNFQGMMDGFARTNLVADKRKLESDLQRWSESSRDRRNRYQGNLQSLKDVIAKSQVYQEKSLASQYLRTSDLLNTARRLYRLSVEKERPDAEREPGYQDRDLTRFKESLIRFDRSFDPEVDKIVWLKFIEEYSKLSQNKRIPSFDRFLGIGRRFDRPSVERKLAQMYQKTGLGDRETRLKWMNADRREFENSNDPFIQLAVAMFESELAQERESKEISGLLQQFRSRYMEALIAYYRSQNKPIYPDANGTLRVTFGRVRGYSPADGAFYKPFTALRGIVEKHTAEDPFNAPQKQLELIERRVYGRYYNRNLNSVAVNFLSDLDTTGGNSGSPTVNSKGELVGLLFDGTYDTILGDWVFTENNSSIHVDITYMLWVMQYVDNATNLLEELNLN